MPANTLQIKNMASQACAAAAQLSGHLDEDWWSLVVAEAPPAEGPLADALPAEVPVVEVTIKQDCFYC